MRNVKWLATAALTVSLAACETYPTASYGGYPGGGYGYSNGYSNGYYAQPTYYQQRPAHGPERRLRSRRRAQQV